MSDRSDFTNSSRRSLLRALAASGTLAVGGTGLTAAAHGSDDSPGNKEGGKDHGNGKSEGKGGNKGKGEGSDRVTGGTALSLAPHCLSANDEFVVTGEGSTYGTIEYWAGCSAAEGATESEEGGGPSPNQTYQEYETDQGCSIFVKASRPFKTGPDARYKVVEVTEACGTYTDENGQKIDVDAMGLGPAGGTHEE